MAAVVGVSFLAGIPSAVSLATMLTQWGLAMAVVIALNGYLVRKTAAGPMTSEAQTVATAGGADPGAAGSADPLEEALPGGPSQGSR